MLKFLNSSPLLGALLGLFIPLHAPWQFFVCVLSGGVLAHTVLDLAFQRNKLDAFLREKSSVLEERIGLYPIPLSRKIKFVVFGSAFWISLMCLLIWGVKWSFGFDIWTESVVSSPAD
jgi:hypothetical protein